MQQFTLKTRLIDQNRSRSRLDVIRSEGLQIIDKYTQLNRQYWKQWKTFLALDIDKNEPNAIIECPCRIDERIYKLTAK